LIINAEIIQTMSHPIRRVVNPRQTKVRVRRRSETGLAKEFVWSRDTDWYPRRRLKT
jgi:hypothetical protein